MAQEDAQVNQDGNVVEQAVGALMAQRGYGEQSARERITLNAAQGGQTVEHAARELLDEAVNEATRTPGQLSSAYMDIAQAVTAISADPDLRRVTQVAVARIPGADWASVTLLSGGRLLTAAATDPQASRADQLQYELGGPCVSAAESASGSFFLVSDLATDGRWPDFGAAVTSNYGIHGVLSVRLALDIDQLNDTTASLNIYAGMADALREEDLTLAALVAAHATTTVIASQYRQRIEQLQQSLQSNRVIGMAMGILMDQRKVTENQAFDLLRTASQNRNSKLRDVAAGVVETGALAGE